jgi:uncharacterized membrane protein (UPF0127 family)
LSAIVLIAVFFINCKAKLPKIESKIAKNSEHKTEIKIKDKKIQVEVADTDEKRALGLMFRQNLEENSGMLFIFEKKGIYPFWMKNTGIPLSIAFIDENDVIIDILEMVPNQEVITYSPTEPFLVALEMNHGWFAENSINKGDTIYGIP